MSSQAQASDDKDSIPNQVASGRDLINRNESWQEVHEPLIVPGHSRSYLFLHDIAEDIPQYEQLMEFARSQSIDLLICRSLDRLGRTDALVSQVAGYLRHHGVQILSLDMPHALVDPQEYEGLLDRTSIWTSAIGRARAEDEMAELRRRHRFGMRRRVRDGSHPNHPPYGYRKMDEGVDVCQEEAEMVKLIFEWFLDGQSPYAIRRRLRVEATVPTIRSISGLYYVLRNPFYCGLVGYSRTDGSGRHRPRSEWLLAEGQHEPLISREDWEAAQLELDRRSKDRRTPYTRHPLSGLIFCGHCGNSMRISITDKGRYRYYVCHTDGCDRNTIKAAEVEEIVADFITRTARDGTFDEEIDSLLAGQEGRDEQEATRLSKAAERLDSALGRYQSDYELGLLGRWDYYSNKARLEDELASVKTRLAAVNDKRLEPQKIQAALSRLGSMSTSTDDLLTYWQNQDEIHWVKATLRQAQLRVTIKGEHVSIAFDLAY